MRWIILSCLLIFSLATYNHTYAQVAPSPFLTITVSDSPIEALAYSPDGSRIATGGRDYIIRVWDTLTGDLVMDTEGHTDWITDLVFTPDGTQLISASRDNSIRRFDASTGALLTVIGQHTNDVTALAITPDNRYILSGGRDDMLKLWDIESGMLLDSRHHLESVWDIIISPSGSYIASASDSGEIHLWRISDNQLILQSTITAHDDAVTALTFSVDDDHLLSASIDRRIRLWDVNQANQPIATFVGHQSSITGISFTQSPNHIVSSSLDGTLRLWDTSTEQASDHIISVSDNPMTHLIYAPDYTQLMMSGISGTLQLWDTTATGIENLLNMPAAAPSTHTQTITLPSSSQALLSMPSISVDSTLTTFPLGGNSWVIDPWETLVGHFEGTAWLNQSGNVVLGGHSEMPDGTDGIFNNLYDLGIGDDIYVQDADIMRRYVIVNIKSVDYRDIRVVMPTRFNRLTLITCDIPSYVSEQNLYYERLVIIADELP